ncbi:MAG TPA: hypothetical protein PLC42_08185 [Parachlamydiaceae bacterium]|nr:hypothetical protein [Parachlamydiaceae bacterium]
MMPFQIQIPKRNALCSLNQEALTAGMSYYSCLSESGDLRRDFCTDCWKQFSKTEEGSQAVRYWKSKVPLKKTKALLPQDKDAHIFAHFKKMLKDPKEFDEERFVLSLYLARRRLIALRKEEIQDDQLFQLYEVLETEEFFSIKKMNLAAVEIEAVQQRLAKKLQDEP